MFVIFGSSLTLTFQDVNMKTDSTGQNVLNYLDYFFTLFFIFEMFLKWFGNGLKRYFTDPWSILDFFIVIVSNNKKLNTKINTKSRKMYDFLF